ncbi:hypothetical protein LTR48_006162, partial [Friedmanniomyces endolithicus]
EDNVAHRGKRSAALNDGNLSTPHQPTAAQRAAAEHGKRRHESRVVQMIAAASENMHSIGLRARFRARCIQGPAWHRKGRDKDDTLPFQLMWNTQAAFPTVQ